MKRDQRIIFRSKDAVNVVRRLSVNCCWDLECLIRADTENQVPYELHFKAEDGDLQVAYVEDPISECSYVIISGQDQNEASSLVKEKADYWTREEILSAWNSARNDTEKILSVLRVGVAAPYEYQAQYADALVKGISNEDSNVREASMVAIGYRDWKEFDSVLEEMSDKDPDEQCRKRAKIMLEIRNRER